jgi:hypothetical protein
MPGYPPRHVYAACWRVLLTYLLLCSSYSGHLTAGRLPGRRLPHLELTSYVVTRSRLTPHVTPVPVSPTRRHVHGQCRRDCRVAVFLFVRRGPGDRGAWAVACAVGTPLGPDPPGAARGGRRSRAWSERGDPPAPAVTSPGPRHASDCMGRRADEQTRRRPQNDPERRNFHSSLALTIRAAHPSKHLD